MIDEELKSKLDAISLKIGDTKTDCDFCMNHKHKRQRKKNPCKCATKFCSGLATKKGHSPYCAKCRERRWKAAHPIKYAFKKLRCRAKERGHAFGLSFEKFTELWNAGMGLIRGKTGHSMTIHRRENNRGYFDDNVIFLTNSCNVRMRYVPYFKSKEAEQDAIAETQKEIELAMREGGNW